MGRPATSGLGRPGWRNCSACAPGRKCAGHREQNKLHARASRARRGMGHKGVRRCGLCCQPGHQYQTCPLEPTR